MIGQHEAVMKLQEIRQEKDSPLRKIRRLLRLRKDLGHAAAKLSQGSKILRGDGEDDCAERVEAQISAMLDLGDEARTEAEQLAMKARMGTSLL
jgi:hypothetical protein